MISQGMNDISGSPEQPGSSPMHSRTLGSSSSRGIDGIDRGGNAAGGMAASMQIWGNAQRGDNKRTQMQRRDPTQPAGDEDDVRGGPGAAKRLKTGGGYGHSSHGSPDGDGPGVVGNMRGSPLRPMAAPLVGRNMPLGPDNGGDKSGFMNWGPSGSIAATAGSDGPNQMSSHRQFMAMVANSQFAGAFTAETLSALSAWKHNHHNQSGGPMRAVGVSAWAGLCGAHIVTQVYTKP